jgi:hypothetical protein
LDGHLPFSIRGERRFSKRDQKQTWLTITHSCLLAKELEKWKVTYQDGSKASVLASTLALKNRTPAKDLSTVGDAGEGGGTSIWA